MLPPAGDSHIGCSEKDAVRAGIRGLFPRKVALEGPVGHLASLAEPAGRRYQRGRAHRRRYIGAWQRLAAVAYADAVREEYPSVAEEVFKPARVLILSAWLHSPSFQPRGAGVEDSAHRDVADEIGDLNELVPASPGGLRGHPVAQRGAGLGGRRLLHP